MADDQVPKFLKCMWSNSVCVNMNIRLLKLGRKVLSWQLYETIPAKLQGEQRFPNMEATMEKHHLQAPTVLTL